MTTYFGSRPVSDWQANGPAESGHNFIDQINEQKGKISGQESQIAAQRANADAARNAYQQAYQNQQSYGDLYDIARQKEGVDTAKNQFQNSSEAVNATQSAMRTLPSSINAGSNVVLTNAQRNAALGNQMNKYQNTLAYQTEQNATDKEMYQTALGAAQNTTQGMVGEQQARVSQAMQDKQTELNQVNALYDQLLQERAIMRQIYGDMYEDEYRHMQRELEIWADNLNAETQRYAQQQENARNAAKIAAQNYATDISKYLGSGYAWDGNKWVAPERVDTSRAQFQNNLNDYYARYMSELDNLDNQTKDPGTYFNPFGSNGIFGSAFGFNSTSNQARNMRDKGFEDYLYNQAPWLQKDLREKYSDLLGYYGLQ